MRQAERRALRERIYQLEASDEHCQELAQARSRLELVMLCDAVPPRYRDRGPCQ